MEVLSSWLAEVGAPPPRVLEGGDLDMGVAMGAATYELVRRGRGRRIHGGTARSLLRGHRARSLRCPGSSRRSSRYWPRSAWRGSPVTVFPEELGVVVGEPVRFRFFSSSVRRDDPTGAQLESWKDTEIEELPIEVTLPAEGRRPTETSCPSSSPRGVTEVGTLLLEAVPSEPVKADERWKIELSVRGDREG